MLTTTGKSHRIHAAHQKYGPVIRVAPNELSFSNPVVARQIYTSKNYVKEKTFYDSKTIYDKTHLFAHRDVEAHSARRKMLSKGFSRASLNDFEQQLAQKVQHMFDQWSKQAADGFSVNAFMWSHMLGFDTIYQLMFGEDLRIVETGTPHITQSYMRSWRPTFKYKQIFPSMAFWGCYIPGGVGDLFRDVKTWKQISIAHIKARRASGKITPYLSQVIDSEDKSLGRPLTDSELAEESMGGMIGGSGTTGNAFTYLLWACLQDPRVVNALQTEIDDAFPDLILTRKNVPPYLVTSKLPYLQATIKETLRLYPTICATLPRTVIADVTLEGTFVPKGVVVGMQNYTIHRDPTAFPDPESFKPERWLVKDGNEKLRNQAFTPFSVGSRQCIGSNLAELELTLAASAFFLRFDGEIDWSRMKCSDMEMHDTFAGSPISGKLWLKLREKRIEQPLK